ncbi:hypothetical protein F5883DRAFT_592575 [Diaporthe sp. PMI_573]|nr:hypothetical protein F5883DRAFT_592575 [Diaporthaceae sp. PMI_573]
MLSNSKLLSLLVPCPWTTFQATAKEYTNLPHRLRLVLHVVHVLFVVISRVPIPSLMISGLLISGLVLIRILIISIGAYHCLFKQGLRITSS